MWVGAEISTLRANKTVSLNSEIETSTASAASRSELNDFFSMDNAFTNTLDVIVAKPEVQTTLSATIRKLFKNITNPFGCA